MSGQIIDASIVAAPRQRNTDAEKAALKENRIPAEWAARPKKLAQKDRDARWTLKRAKARKVKTDGTKAKVEIAIPVFGYKTHVSIDRRHGFVRRFGLTSAAAHDGAQLANVLDTANTASDVQADSAYHSKTNDGHLAKQGRRSKIHFRRQPGHDLTPPQRKADRARSKVRSAVETVFAAQKHRFGFVVRTIGMARARTQIGLADLAYKLTASSGSKPGQGLPDLPKSGLQAARAPSDQPHLINPGPTSASNRPLPRSKTAVLRGVRSRRSRP